MAIRFFKRINIGAGNTRLFKKQSKRGRRKRYEIRLASSLASRRLDGDDLIGALRDDNIDADRNPAEYETLRHDDIVEKLGHYEFEGIRIDVTRGDYSGLLTLVVESLLKAKRYASNPNEVRMLSEYAKSFLTGSLQAGNRGARFWIKDKTPVIETCFGFDNHYRDPTGQRGGFTSFVAIVNKEKGAKFKRLVSNADEFLALLPWPRSFERDTFMPPQFTYLDVLTFASCLIPQGISFPSEDEVEQSYGFKNVYLGNVISAHSIDSDSTVLPYLTPDDQEVIKKYEKMSQEILVGLHELLGHGSGKVFSKSADSTLNYEPESMVDLSEFSTVAAALSADATTITSFYEPGETFVSKFEETANAYEECRAECVALYLSLDPRVLKIFGVEGAETEELIYANWLSMTWNGLCGLDTYQAEHEKWGQAHSQARYVILQVLIEAGQDFVVVAETTRRDGRPTLLVTLDRSKIMSVGKEAIGNFLLKLQVYKSTGNVEAGVALFDKYSFVHPANDGSGFPPFLDYQKIMMEPSTFLAYSDIFLQSNTRILRASGEDDVALVTYNATHEGLIMSWIDRYPDPIKLFAILEELCERDSTHFDF